jgi:putative ABC transport system permease protein
MRGFRIPGRSRDRIRADLDDELEFHFQMRTEELMRSGMSKDDARRLAEREFGDAAFTREYCETLDRAGERESRRADWLGDWWNDLRATVRDIRRRPGYGIVVMLTMALGIGANTAVFSVLDSVLLRRLPFPRAERLVTVDELNMRTGTPRSDIAAGEYLDWTRAQRSFEGIAVHGARSLTYTGGATPTRLDGRRVSANFFDVLGVRAALGRTFQAGEDQGTNRVILLANGTWKQFFGGDPAIVGRQVLFGGDPYTVIGVLPADFVFPGQGSKQFFVPIDFAAAMNDVNRARKFHFMHGFARLEDGVSIDDARADLTAVAHTIERDNPSTSQGHLITVLPLESALVGNVKPTILALMGAAFFVLLIGAANLANLALSRAMARHQEFAVRAALGAGRGRLARLALTESTTLAAAGGALGLAVAWWGTPALLALYPAALPPTFAVHTSGTALTFALALSLGTGVAFGVAPALAARRVNVAGSLRAGARGATAGRIRARGRSALVVAQVALAMILVVGAGLLIRTLQRLQALELGFEPRDISWTWVSVSGPRYREGPAIVAFWDGVLSQLRQTPGIESASLSGAIPLAGGSGASIAIDGRPNVEPLPSIRYGVYSDGFLETFGVRLVSGRNFSSADRADGTRLVLINEAAAKKFWPGQSPIGARIRLGPDPSQPWSEVIGVIADYRQEQLDAPPPPLAVDFYRQDVWSSMFIAVKSNASPAALRQTITAIVKNIDPAIAVEAPKPLDLIINSELGARRFAMSILSVFGAVALLLAVVGVYGVIAYGVASRRQEFGVRIALGAVPRQVLTRVLSQGAVLALTGLAIGGIASVFLTRFLATLLFGVEPRDVGTFAIAGGVLAVATLVACFVPARRAAAVDPVEALKD